VECDPKGVGADPPRCERAGVRRYPTWLVGGQRHEGVMSVDDLARASGFAAASK
jgi:hypothetical protein